MTNSYAVIMAKMKNSPSSHKTTSSSGATFLPAEKVTEMNKPSVVPKNTLSQSEIAELKKLLSPDLMKDLDILT